MGLGGDLDASKRLGFTDIRVKCHLEGNATRDVYYAVAYTLLCLVLLVVNRKALPRTVRTAYGIIRGRGVPDEYPSA